MYKNIDHKQFTNCLDCFETVFKTVYKLFQYCFYIDFLSKIKFLNFFLLV